MIPDHESGWTAGPLRPFAVTDEVHVWRAALDRPREEIARLYAVLSPDERDRAGRFVFDRDVRRFVVARGTLRELLGHYLSTSAEELAFRSGPNGKPALARHVASRLTFNLSHSHELVLFAIALGRDVGVDLEYLRPNLPVEIARSWLTPREVAALVSLPEEQRPATFLRGWTRKEAVVKAWGDGLVMPLSSFEVSLSPSEPAELLSIRHDSQPLDQWSLRELFPHPDYIAAVAVEGQEWRLRTWNW